MYTLVLHPETFVFSDDSSFLLYNSESHQNLECKHSPFSDALFKRLGELTSLYRADVAPDEYADNLELINRIVDLGLGELYKNKEDAPYSYAPILKLNYDFKGLDRLHDSNEDYYLLRFLQEITFFVSGELKRDSYFSQIPFPLSGSGQQLTDTGISSFLDSARYCNIKKINLMVSFPEDLDTVEPVVSRFLERYPFHVYIRMGSIVPERIIAFASRNPSVGIHLVGFINEVPTAVNNLPIDLLIADEVSLKMLAERPELNIQRIIPFYQGDKEFFLKHTTIEKRDILGADKNDIFIRQTLNPHFFGKLFMFPDGTVSDSHFGERLGDINELIHTLIRREIETKGMWFFTRDKTPCHDCRFKYLCPSPSTYEVYLNQYDFCFLSAATT